MDFGRLLVKPLPPVILPAGWFYVAAVPAPGTRSSTA